MTTSQPVQQFLPILAEKMKADGLPKGAIDMFSKYYCEVASGKTGQICNADIRPVDPSEITDLLSLSGYEERGKRAFSRAARIVLNGGLGTSMGLLTAKSLLKVKNGKSFLAIIFDQVDHQNITLALMNSYNTDRDTRNTIRMMGTRVRPEIFLQHKFPKILKGSLAPAVYPENPEMEWNPPGHGNVYTALSSSGVLERLLKMGIEYALISNSDNLGAVLDASLLGFFAEKDAPFMMEVAERTPADIKGGHLAVRHDGHFILRESAQCPREELPAFRDIRQYRYFNTNNIWLNLPFLRDFLKENPVLPLPLILNEKTLNPRDAKSPAVYQIESAMGAAISLFSRASVVLVPSSRMIPVKKCSDLLPIRSDRYMLTPDSRLIVNPKCQNRAIRIELDRRYYEKIDDFENRFDAGIPSLVECDALSIVGDVRFEAGAKILGNVRIENPNKRQATVRSGTVIDKDLVF